MRTKRLAVLLSFGVLVSMVTAAPAAAAPGSIGGVVVEDTTLNAAVSVSVDVYDLAYTIVGSTFTASDGSYQVDGLVPGTYRVFFSSLSHVNEWHLDAADFASAADVVVTDTTVTMVDASLSVGGSVTGVVSEDGTGTPIPGASVDVYDTGYEWVASSWTALDGSYTVAGLVSGTYRLYVASVTHLSEWHADAADFASATDVAVGTGSATTVDVSLALTGSISGVVVEDGTGAAIGGVQIAVYDAGQNWVGSGTTASDGSYSVDGLTAGSYRMRFESSTHVDEWHLDAGSFDSASPVDVLTGVATTIDASLAVGGTIAGTVTEDGTAAAVSDVYVDVYDATGTSVAFATTASDGSYTVATLVAGVYRVRFFSTTHLNEWHQDAPDFASASDVVVVDGATSVVDGSLTLGGTISGVVTEDGSGAPVPGGRVLVFTPGYSPAFDFTSSIGEIAPDGTYSVPGLVSGSYRVQISSFGYVSEWYLDTDDFSTATDVVVTEGATSTVNASVASPGSLSGTIIEDGTGAPIPGVTVILFGTDHSNLASAITDASGAYVVSGVAPGAYALQAVGTSAYLGEWYNDRPAFWASDLVTIASGADTAGVDFALTVGGTIAGRVTQVSAPTTGIGGVEVRASTDSRGWQQLVGSTTTDTNGDYAIVGLLPDSYRVEFRSDSFADEWHQDAGSFETAKPVSVSPGTTAVVDAELDALGSISGSVNVAATGTPIDSAEVVAVPRAPWGGWDQFSSVSVFTDPSGGFVLGALEPGEYAIEVRAAGFVTEVWNDIAGSMNDWATANLAEPVPVVPGLDTPGIIVGLSPAGFIGGTVSDAASLSPIAGIDVTVTPATEEWTTWMASTDALGEYLIAELAPGEYKVEFSPGATGYIHEWYQNTAGFESATIVMVLADGSVTTVDGSLTTGASISGVVTTLAGDPLGPEVTVIAESTNGISSASATPDAAGAYTIGGLAPGSYRIRVTAWSGNTLDTWYDGAANALAASLIDVGVGEAVGGIDIAMRQGGSISGAITRGSSGPPSVYANVQLRTVAGDLVASTYGDGIGAYTFEGVVPGNYLIMAPGFGYDGFLDTWYDGAATSGTATPIAVDVASVISGIDIGRLPVATGGPATQVSGTVTRDGGVAFWGVSVVFNRTDASAYVAVKTDASGYYSALLEPGDYAVEYTFSMESPFVAQWYNGRGFFDTADTLTVGTVPITGLDAEMVRGGTITGTVTDGSAAPIGGVQVGVHAPGSTMFWAETAADGTYVVESLPPGSYTVEFSHAGHVGEWFDNAPDGATATPVAVTAAATTPNVDAQLALGGSISGAIAPFEGFVRVAVYDAGGARIAFTDLLTGVTSYALSGIPTGTYHVRLESETYFGLDVGVPRWYGGATDEWWSFDPLAGYGTPVSVVDGVDTPSIDLGLAPATSISGTVTDADSGAPLPGRSVWIHVDGTSSPLFPRSDLTSTDGRYTLFVGPGTYRLEFAGDATYVPQWWNDAPDPTSATTVTVGVGEIRTGYDAAVVAYGGVSGTVLDDAGVPVNRAVVDVFDVADMTSPVATVESVPDGTYTSLALVPGSYKLRVTDPTGTVPPIWYDARPDAASAATVAVSSWTMTAGIDFVLDPTDATPPSVSVSTPVNWSTVSSPVSVTGTATDDVGVAQVDLEVFDRDSALWWSGSLWQAGRTSFVAVLDTPGGTSVGWSYGFDPGTPSAQPYWVTVRSFDAAANVSGYQYVNFAIN